MSDFPSLQNQLATKVTDLINANHNYDDSVKKLLIILIDSLPPYTSAGMMEALYGNLANVLAANLPNNRIIAQPSESTAGCTAVFDYDGPYSGYQDAFFNGMSLSVSGKAVYDWVLSVNKDFNGNWWGNFCVPVLTDAIYQSGISVDIDSGKLAQDLANINSSYFQALAATYLAVYETGYSPTASAWSNIMNTSSPEDAYSLLQDIVWDDGFITNINISLSQGGDANTGTTWFLYNLWITFKSLTKTRDVNDTIQQCINKGMLVPGQITPWNWWNGTYRSWFGTITGSVIAPKAAATMAASLPQKETVLCFMGPVGGSIYTSAPNGYCYSLCSWGSLNWYKPSNGSCFGKNTGVLMGDGTVKPISDIRIGDTIFSSEGPRRVVLIETPRRAGRTLYQLNDQEVYATAAHPFRGAGPGPMRYSMAPWNTVDQVPTFLWQGVGQLAVGVCLAAKDEAVKITQVTVLAPPPKDEMVYDLLLENWDKGHATYYVGGPDHFFAVDAETSDPMYHAPTTAGILAAMEVTLSVSRKMVLQPATQLPALLLSLQLRNLVYFSVRQSRLMAGTRPRSLQIPGPQYYLRDGCWDPHASILEQCLVSKMGYQLRRESATGWRPRGTPQDRGNRFLVTLHDISMIDNYCFLPNQSLSLQLHWYNELAETAAQYDIHLPTQHVTSWFLWVDKLVNLGYLPPTARGLLVGKLYAQDQLMGSFSAACNEVQLHGQTTPHYIFDEAGKAIGRMALSLARVSRQDLQAAEEIGRQWTARQAYAMAIAFGQQAGIELAALIQKNYAQ